jgi:hypothetical protein
MDFLNLTLEYIMRRLSIGLCLAFLFLFFVPVSHAQTRWLLGVSGGDNFDNYSFGVQGGVEIPFAKRYELDLKDTFSPIETHVSLGSGRANATSAGGYIWVSKSWGLNGRVEDSMYDVTKVSKDADYAFGGLTYRALIGGFPSRLSFDYIQQFNNGIAPSGVETSHLQGADFSFTTRFGCVGPTCVRISEDFDFGRVLTQGNPVCDGTYGVTGGPNGGPCPRQGALGGGVSASVVLEFPRHRGHENDVF